jgi:hypothetical protein
VITYLFFSVYKVNTKLITIAILIEFGCIPYIFPMLGLHFFFFNNYMISMFKIDVTNIRLFVFAHVFIAPKQLVSLMLFLVALYSFFDYLHIVK